MTNEQIDFWGKITDVVLWICSAIEFAGMVTLFVVAICG